MKKCLIASLILLLPAGVMAQEGWNIVTSGGFKAGVQQVDNTNNSAKFNEYRDIDDGVYLYDLDFEAVDKNSGLFLELGGKNISRDDESARLGIGSYGTWRLQFDRNEIPRNISNKAMTPYIERGDGLYIVPTPVALPSTDVGGTLTSGYNLAPNATQAAAGLLRNNDAATAAWLETTLHETDLGTDRDKNSATLTITPSENWKFRLSYSDETKDGSKISYGPIGDRPPRTLNIQLAEPIDYQTREVKLEAEYNADRFQSLFAYTVSDFNNDIDTLRWQNIYARTTGADPSYDQWAGHRVGTFGERALAPDNQYQNFSLTFGIDLPMSSRLAGTVAYGKLEQDEDLIPYATSSFGSTTVNFNSTAALPRTKADAEIETMLYNFEYTIKPVDRLNLRAFYRFYELDNNTDEDNWRYITSDTIPGSSTTTVGNSTYKNMRTNLAYGYDQQNYGLDATYSMNFWRTTLGLGYEREEIDRDYREADTDENAYNVSVRTRPSDWLSLRVKYLYGDRQGDDYNTFATADSYWYALGDQGSDRDNPKFTFTNHPDMRKYDVADRERNQVDVAATVMPTESLNLTASYRWQDDDFDSSVDPSQPLLNYPGTLPLNTSGDLTSDSANRTATTPGDQVGLLSRETERYALDASYAPNERLNLSAFWSHESIDTEQRGFEIDENHKMEPATFNFATSELGPFTRASSQWLAKTEDRTNTIGASAGYQIIPGKLNFIADYIFSHGKVDIDYSGFGVVSSLDPTVAFADNYQFAFRNPSTVTHKQYTLNATLEYQVVKNLVIGLHYIFDRYKISDWMQEENQPWFESVGSEFLLRDTSSASSTQWGNRLVNLGSYLGPSYETHTTFLTVTYKF